MKEFHILNGDVLKEQFPSSLEGEIIIARECMVDGPVNASSLDEFWAIRSDFICNEYSGCTPSEYELLSKAELEKVVNIPDNSIIYLWFEDDLFCQVNLWFVAFLLMENHSKYRAFLVRPPVHTPYGFGGLSQDQLLEVFDQATELKTLDRLATLWRFYQKDDHTALLDTASELSHFPFILEAVIAHIDRLPHSGMPGKPIQVLEEIISELGSENFGPVFREFCKRVPIYGFGDVQVKRLFDRIVQDEY